MENFLSIVIITCNRKKELEKTLKSCMSFADMNCEIIIVDNNSNDGTKEMVEQFETPKHVIIRPFFMHENLGVAGARNYGFKMANSKVVYFIDDDAYFDEDSKKLSYAYYYLLNNHNVFAIATEINDLKKKCMLKERSEKGNVQKVFSFIGASHFIRKDYVKTKDLYPEKLFYGSEERYACLCAYKDGLDIAYCEEIKVIHDPSTFTRASNYENIRNIYINTFIVKRLTLPKSLLPISTIMFYLRLVRFCNWRIDRYFECYKLYKERYIDNKYGTYRLPFKSALQLMKRFGIKMVL